MIDIFFNLLALIGTIFLLGFGILLVAGFIAVLYCIVTGIKAAAKEFKEGNNHE